MTLYIHRSLAGSENEDVLTYVESFVGDNNADVYISYNSLYGLGGDDTISVAYKPVLFVDGGAGQDTIDYQSSPINKGATILGGTGDDNIRIGPLNSVFPLRIDGGSGADMLEIASGNLYIGNIKNIETLLIMTPTVVRGDLSTFDSVDVRGEITYGTAAHLADVNFVRTKAAISIMGSDEDDLLDLRGQMNMFSIYGNDGDDTIIGGAGAMTASGGHGIDVVQGGAGNDALDAGGIEKKPQDGAFETVLGNGGNDVVTFLGESGYFDGGDGKDTLAVDGDMDDIFSLGQGTAVGFEVLNFRGLTEIRVDQDFFEGLDTTKGYGWIGFSEAVQITELPAATTSRIWLRGSDHGDVFKLSGSDSNIVLEGGKGGDVFSGSDRRVNLSGEAGDDRLSGGAAKDSLDGGDGDDWLVGGSNDDSILGGRGNDTIFGGDGSDLLNAGTGDASVKGGAGNDWIELRDLRAQDSQTISGGTGNDYILYGEFGGNHSIDAATMTKAATLTISGGEGRDTLNISGNLSHVSAKGVESLMFENTINATPEFISSFKTVNVAVIWPDRPEAWIYLSSSGTLRWRGDGIDAVIVGVDGVDKMDFSGSGEIKQDIYLEGGNDVFRFGATGIVAEMAVHGGAGNDTFYGAKGDDIVKGDSGHDIFIARSNGGVDIFEDFTSLGKSSDVIDLRGVTEIESYKDLRKNHLILENSSYFIDMGAHGRLVLGNFRAVADLTEVNFLF